MDAVTFFDVRPLLTTCSSDLHGSGVDRSGGAGG
jgi:hypothetical protein